MYDSKSIFGNSTTWMGALNSLTMLTICGRIKIHAKHCAPKFGTNHRIVVFIYNRYTLSLLLGTPIQCFARNTASSSIEHLWMDIAKWFKDNLIQLHDALIWKTFVTHSHFSCPINLSIKQPWYLFWLELVHSMPRLITRPSNNSVPSTLCSTCEKNAWESKDKSLYLKIKFISWKDLSKYF